MSGSSLNTYQLVSRHIVGRCRSESKTVQIDGEGWKYFEKGNPHGEAIFFLHGFGGNKSYWHSMMHDYDAQSYRLLALDIPGASLDRFFVNKKHNITSLARWLDAYFEALGIPSAHIVAHSCTALFAAFYASTRSARALSLALISTPELLTPDAYAEGGMLTKFLNDVCVNSVDDVYRFNASLFYSAPAILKSVLKYKFQKHLNNHRKMREIIDEYVETLQLVIPHTKKITCPILSVKGDTDIFSPSDHDNEIRRHFRGAKVVTIPQAGHAVILEKPSAIAAAHKAFIADAIPVNAVVA